LDTRSEAPENAGCEIDPLRLSRSKCRSWALSRRALLHSSFILHPSPFEVRVFGEPPEITVHLTFAFTILPPYEPSILNPLCHCRVWRRWRVDPLRILGASFVHPWYTPCTRNTTIAPSAALAPGRWPWFGLNDGTGIAVNRLPNHSLAAASR
jgi:hypothetical protein